ncbi:YmgD family protein [Ruegeria pomeroyi]|uniref:YmgD family protein n=1 Tax=Ruegeria pomeroyi TaxID=89184 RepID=A0A9Q3WM27_9RHOB|nr:YmgD family protein [Ruegeria pomeroyi]MCE8537882.1 YmgD family protein [Ruegeria pomeroyi]
MFHSLRIPTIALAMFALSGTAQADEEMQRIIAAAMPHMHYSCESVLEAHPGDDQVVADIVRLMAMVSLYNRQIDILALIPDEADRAGLKDDFVKELGDTCDDDPGRLLAAAVDDAVKETMDAYE